MPYWNTQGKNISSIESFGLGNTGHSHGAGNEFYEIEPAVVLDIILAPDHPFFKQPANVQSVIDTERWPADFQGKKPTIGDFDYSWVGRASVRLLHTTPRADKEKLIWAYPLDYSASEYPLINEIVLVYLYKSKYFYSRRLNLRNLPNEAVDFAINHQISGAPNNELYTTTPYSGRTSKASSAGQAGYTGVAGKYLKLNDKVRSITRYEGDMVIESRFGQTIRFGAYDANRNNDSGDPKNPDYSDFGGNPMVIIRNRQRKILPEGQVLKLVNSPNPKPVTGTKYEKNAGGFIPENINHDGSTLAITSGQTISDWATTCYKKMFGVGEEVGAFTGKSSFTYPVLNGDQVVLNTDRIVLSSRYGETFHYAKKRYGIVTDSEYTVDAQDQVVLTTHNKVVINSPAIYLGEYDRTDEPAVLGQTHANWCWDLIEWLKKHTHWYHHSHTDAGQESPSQTQVPVEIQELIGIQNRINTWLSRRVFMTGGGFAPGQNGASIPNGSTPTNINVGTGGGVPGGWKGANHR